MRIVQTGLTDVVLLEPKVHGDHRGFFLEYFHAERFAEHGLDLVLLQCNHSRSSKGVLRGLHYQLQRPQGKLVQVISGEVFDVAVDIRKGSPTFGQWAGEILSESNHRQLYIPAGFAHGFCVLSDHADFLYFCTDFYRPGDEYGIAWDDPELAIEWPGGDFRISEKDQSWLPLSQSGNRLPVYEGVS